MEKKKSQKQQHCVYAALKEQPLNRQTTQILQLERLVAAQYYAKLHILEFSVVKLHLTLILLLCICVIMCSKGLCYGAVT